MQGIDIKASPLYLRQLADLQVRSFTNIEAAMNVMNNLKYKFIINDDGYETDDPVVSGRQLMQIAAFDPADEHILIQIFKPGSQSIGLEEKVGLREKGKESFRVFKSDRTFSFTVDERGYEWGKRKISVVDIREIADIGSDQDLFLERKDEADEQLQDGVDVDLGARGTEHIRSEKKHPKYCINIEGVGIIDWDLPTITAEQIAELGGWNISEGVVEVDEDNNERTLVPGEVIELKPGIGFCKKHRWKRG
tara:strand:+ start:1592 stop:2341 length:750 start_codon:yes stop_codon:yes gene_type:complete